MEEVVALLAGNLKAHKTEAFSRDNGLLTLAADNIGPGFHGSPPQLLLALSYSTARYAALPILVGSLHMSSRRSHTREEHISHPALRMRGFAARHQKPVLTDRCGRRSSLRCTARVLGGPRR